MYKPRTKNMYYFGLFVLVPLLHGAASKAQITCYHCANVTHTYECLKTETCYGDYESCFVQANFENGNVTYTQGCMSSQFCNSGSPSGIVGRSLRSRHPRQQEFDEFECCHEDRCNIHDSEVSGLVFKISAHIGGEDVLKAWLDGANTVSHDYCRNVRTYGCSKHYRHPVLDNWLGVNRDLIKYALYKDEVEVASIWFNGTGSTLSDWFSHSRVINSSWTDLKPTNTHIFSLQGGPWTRRFSVEKSYGGCPADYGWTVVIASRHTGYCGYDNYNIDAPYILYAKGNSSAHYPEGFDFADAAAVYIYGREV